MTLRNTDPRILTEEMIEETVDKVSRIVYLATYAIIALVLWREGIV